MPPGWFRDAVANLKDVGLLGHVELSDFDLGNQWRRFGGGERGGVLAAVVAGHRARTCRLEDWQVASGGWLRQLSEISGGAVKLRAKRSGREALRRLKVSSDAGAIELVPTITLWIDELVECFDPRQILGALNQCTDSGQYCIVGERVVFLRPRERDALVAELVAIEEPTGTRWPRQLGGSSVITLLGECTAPPADTRDAYRPIFAPAEADSTNRIGGQPWGRPPPDCPQCGEYSIPLVQVRLGHLPLATRRTGTVQAFACCGQAIARIDQRTTSSVGRGSRTAVTDPIEG